MRSNKVTSKKALKAKMSQAFSDELNTLSSEMREILLDDIACAFENRLKVLAKADSPIQFALNVKKIECLNAPL